MSLVGPRPIRPVFFEQLCEEIPQYWQRLVVRPGLTGFAQLRMARDMTWAEKLAHDLEWLADRSVGLYLSLIVATAWRVLQRGAGDVAAMRPRRVARRPCAASAASLALDGGAADERAVRAMAGALVHRGPGQRGRVRRRPRRARPRGAWRSSTSRAATSRCATRTASVTVVQNGELYEHRRAAGRPGAARAPLRVALRHRGAAAPLRGARPDFAVGPARHVRDRAVGRPGAPARCSPATRSGSSRCTTASRTACCRSPRSSRRSCASRGSRGEVDLEALEAYLAFNSVPAPMSIYRDVRKLPRRAPARGAATAGSRCGGSRGRRRCAAGRRAARGRPRARGRAARAAARLGPRAPRVRRAGRRLPVRRHRLVAARRARRAGEPGRGADVLDRLRGAVVRRARRGRAWWRRATGPTTTSSCCAPTPPRCCPRSRRRSTSRSRTRRRCRPTRSRGWPRST